MKLGSGRGQSSGNQPQRGSGPFDRFDQKRHHGFQLAIGLSDDWTRKEAESRASCQSSVGIDP